MAGRRTSAIGTVVSLGIALLLVASPAWAGGVELLENGRGQGNANAGSRSEGGDASTVWWNPAAMTRFQGHSVALAVHGIIPQARFRDQGSFRVPPPVGLPFTGEPGLTEEGVVAPVAYGVWSLSSRWKIGLGVNTPFGFTTDWGRTWIGRYHATKSALVTVNLNPCVAYRINRNWSVAAGVSAMYADVELSKSIDFGAALMAPQTLDGHVKMTGDSWGIGFNVGVLWEPTACTRVGVHYRSQVEQKVEGKADFDVPAGAAGIVAATGRFVDTDAKADVTFPDSLGVSVYHELSPTWAVMGDVTWTGWSSFEELRIRFSNPNEPDSVTPWDWDDSWRVAVGATYRPTWRWAFRGGLAWDQSPIPDSTRTPRIPGNDRFWMSLGVGYRFNRCWSLDVFYTHVFVQDAPVDQASQEAGLLRGEFEAGVDVVGLQVNWDF